jgi:hypothetical protein
MLSFPNRACLPDSKLYRMSSVPGEVQFFGAFEKKGYKNVNNQLDATITVY